MQIRSRRTGRTFHCSIPRAVLVLVSILHIIAVGWMGRYRYFPWVFPLVEVLDIGHG